MLKLNDKISFICGYKFCLNNHALGNIVDDKHAFFEVMKAINIPIIDHEVLFAKNNTNFYAIGSNNIDATLKYFYGHNKKIVIKSNTGTCGTEVFLIKSKTELIKVINKLTKIAQKLINTIDLNFGSIDIIETDDNKFMLMEANSGVMMNNFILQIDNGYEIAKNIYEKAILEMLKNNS